MSFPPQLPAQPIQHPLLLQHLRTALGIQGHAQLQQKLNQLRLKGEGGLADGLQSLLLVMEQSLHLFERQLQAQQRRADSLQAELDAGMQQLAHLARSLGEQNLQGDCQHRISQLEHGLLKRETEQLALLAAEARNRRMLEGLREIVFQANARGHWTYLNPSWFDITGFTIKESLGQRALSFVHPEDRKSHQAHLQALFQRETDMMRLHVRFVTYKGDYRWLEVSARRIEDERGRITGFTGSLVDITEQKMAQDQLKESEERLHQALLATNSCLWDWDLAQDAPYVDPRWWKNLGYNAQHAAELHWRTQIHPEDWPRWQQHLDEHLKRQRSELDLELRFASRDGGWRHASLRGKVVQWRARRALRLAGTLLDITSRKQAEEAAQRQRELSEQILDQLPISVFLKDREGRFVRINRAFAELSKLQREEILGKQIDEFSAPAWASASRDEDEQAWRTRQLVTTERRFRNTEPPLDLQINRIVIDIAPGESYLLGFSIDVTEQRAVREALQRAVENAQAASHAKSEFLANMSHEIRTPMNGIIGMTELALETTLTREVREYLTLVKGSADALLIIINDILDFSKIEAGKLDIEDVAFDLKKLVMESAKTMSLRAHEKELELLCEFPDTLPSHVRGDPGRLRQVLLNLLGNAVKFTHRGEIVLSLRPALSADGRNLIEFEVRDSGIGIAHDKQELIFEAFSQVDGSTTRQYGGTGLGLTICKRLVKLMQGNIEVESEPGAGSIFRFTIPLHYVGEAGGMLPLEQLQGQAVLIIDSDSKQRRFAADTLTDAGLVVSECANIAAGLTWLSSQPPPAFILLGHSEGQDGIAHAQQILRSNHPPPLMIELPDSEEYDRAELAGIDMILVRPLQGGELLEGVRQLLGRVNQANAAGAGHSAQLENAAHQGASMQILLAEDNLVNQRLALRLIERLGHHATLVDNGLAVVQRATSERYDVILMDLQMPGLDGLAATRQIRAWEAQHGGHVPIIAMTARAMQGDRERCFAAGMDDYLSKPVHSARLRQMLEHYQGQAQRCAPDQVLQWRHALQRLDGEAELLLELAAIFLKDGPQLLLRLQEALMRGEHATVSAEVHSLRGALVNFGAQQALAQTDRLGQAIKHGENIDDLLEITDELEVALHDVYSALQSLIESGAQALLRDVRH
ncbi:PAS domain S-box protein [Massilia sp. W12]|uniref:PAS domain-containing hybrid sensor histidine kinase/response regulator n=1 Tax=Massilia sp. W12 TaxID=3126507 RepID=UPI0030CA6C33